MKQRTPPVKSLRTTFRILEELVESHGATVTELSDHLDLANSTTHDHLRSLRELGYVVNCDGEYRVSTNLLRLGEKNRQDRDIFNISKPELAELAQSTREYASLVIEEDDEAVILATERGENAVPLKVYNGIRMKMHTTAPGKAMLAEFPDERVHEIVDEKGLEAVTDNTIDSRSELFDELDQISEQGYALGHEERVVGVRTIGTALVDKSGRVRGAISVWGPTNRINDTKFREEFPQAVQEVANVIEIQLNYE